MGPFAFWKHLKEIALTRPEAPASVADSPLLRVILNRRSIRRFESREVPDETLQVILEAGRVAPSSVNLQPWSFFVFSAAQWKQHFGEAVPFAAPHAVIVCGDTHRLKPALKEFSDYPLFEYTLAVMNASLAAMNMNVAAEALGISSLMLSETGKSGIFHADYLKEKLALPSGVFPLMTIVFGYAKGGYPAMPPKLPASCLIFQDRYRETPPEILRDWYAKMTVGYKTAFPLKTFKGQLKFYRDHIQKAEQVLKKMVFPHPEE